MAPDWKHELRLIERLAKEQGRMDEMPSQTILKAIYSGGLEDADPPFMHDLRAKFGIRKNAEKAQEKEKATDDERKRHAEAAIANLERNPSKYLRYDEPLRKEMRALIALIVRVAKHEMHKLTGYASPTSLRSAYSVHQGGGKGERIIITKEKVERLRAAGRKIDKRIRRKNNDTLPHGEGKREVAGRGG